MTEQMLGFWTGLMKPPQPVSPPSPMAAFAQMFGQAPQATALPGADLFAQAQQMFGQMQQALLPLLAQHNLDPAAIAEQWQKAIGDSALPATLMAPFTAAFSPGFAAEMRGNMDSAPLGLMREHQQRLQAFAQAQIDQHAAMQRYMTLLQRVQREAQSGFETRLREHSEPGRQLQSARALFDLWIDAAEAAFAEAALGPEYRHVYGELVNAQMRQRKCGQDLMEQHLKSLGLPSRGELDSSHKRAYEMGRELRALKLRVAELEAGSGRAAAPVAASGSASTTASSKATSKRSTTSGKSAKASAATKRAAPQTRPEPAPAAAEAAKAELKAAKPKAAKPSAFKPKAIKAKPAGSAASKAPVDSTAPVASKAVTAEPAASVEAAPGKPKRRSASVRKPAAKSAAKSAVKASSRRKALPPLFAATPKAPPAPREKAN